MRRNLAFLLLRVSVGRAAQMLKKLLHLLIGYAAFVIGQQYSVQLTMQPVGLPPLKGLDQRQLVLLGIDVLVGNVEVF